MFRLVNGCGIAMNAELAGELGVPYADIPMATARRLMWWCD